MIEGEEMRALEQRVSGLESRVDRLETSTKGLQSSVEANTRSVKEMLRLQKRVQKDTAKLIGIVQAAENAGAITVKSMSLFRKCMIWVTPIATGAYAVYLVVRDLLNVKGGG
jgi:exonuclease VII small subunit